jgi:hypothetical protein
MALKNQRVLEIEEGSISSHCVENQLGTGYGLAIRHTTE